MKKPSVLLLFPNTSNEGVHPLAIAILSSTAKKAGFEVRYFETSFYSKSGAAVEDRERTGEFKPVDRGKVFNLLPYERMQEDFSEVVRDFKPDVLAVSANSLEYDLFSELIEGVRFDGPKPFVLVGGCHATIAPEEVMGNPNVDAVCIGEGEGAWEEFLTLFKSGDDITDVRNLWVRCGSGVKRNPVRQLIGEDELWETPLDLGFFDDRHFLKPFDGRMYRRGNIELSRGCPYSCSYCVNSAYKEIFKGKGKFLRFRPFENVQKGIKTLLDLGSEMLQLQDECFLSIKLPLLEQFCKWYAREVRLPLLFHTRPESVTEEKVRLVAEMGVPVQATLGVESGSERILGEICNRRTTLDQVRSAFEVLKKYNLRTNAYTMIGLPTETREEVFETISLMREIKPDVSIMSVFYPFKGVPLRKLCIEKGYMTGDELARTFTDASILKNQPMTPEEIKNLRRTYRLYTKLPEEHFPKIELCERDYEGHKDLFKELVALSWDMAGA